MKKHGDYSFPTESTDEWEPVIAYRCLHANCMIVARTRVEGAWKAYCGPVDGMNHDREARDEERGPLCDGDTVPENVARVLFPQFEGVPYAK